MEEGTFPKDPKVAMPELQNSWDVANSSNQNQRLSTPVPIVFKTEDGSGDNGSPHSSKKILKLVIGLFVLITIILSFFTFILPNFGNKEVKNVKLTYWGLFDDESTMKPILTQFEEENPNIQVEYKKQDLNEYLDRLIVRSDNGNGPDVFSFHNTWYPPLSNLLSPIPGDVMSKNQFDENYYEFMKGDLIQKSKVYGIPLHTDTLSLFVNTAIFQQASTEIGSEIPIPKTWEEFIYASRDLTKRDDSGGISIAGAGIGTYDNVNHAPDILSLILIQNGVDLDRPALNKIKIADTLRFYANFTQVENNVWDSTQDMTKTAFAQGRLAMFFGYAKDYADIKKQNPGIQMKVVPVPQLISDERKNIASYWADGISQKSKHPKEAALLIKFLARKDIQEKLNQEQAKSRQVGDPYSYKSLASKLQGTDLYTFVEQSNTAKSSVFISDTWNKNYNDKYNESLREAVNAVLSGESEQLATEEMLKGFSQTTRELQAPKEE